jgi:molybdopterin converting factor small subunit
VTRTAPIAASISNGVFMGVNVIIHPNLLANLEEQLSVSVQGATVGDCLAAATAKVPQFLAENYLKDGELLGHVLVYVNRVDAYPNELARPVEDGDRIELIPIIGGG